MVIVVIVVVVNELLRHRSNLIVRDLVVFYFDFLNVMCVGGESATSSPAPPATAIQVVFVFVCYFIR